MPSIFRALQGDVVWHCVLFAFLLASPSIRSRSMWYIPNPLAPGSRMKGHIHPIIKYIWWEKERRLAVNDIFMDGCNSGCVFQYLNKHYKFRWRQLFSGSNKKWNELWGGFNAQRVWCRLIGICWGHRDGGGGGIGRYFGALLICRFHSVLLSWCTQTLQKVDRVGAKNTGLHLRGSCSKS